LDERSDIALLKVEANNLPTVTIGDAEQLQVGQWVLAIGSPFGLEQTVTAGIVSAKGRIIGSGPYDDFIQTDASINPGNSGGPLLNMDGEVVGINTAIASKTGSFIGYSFAIPVDIVRKVVADLLEYGEVQRAYLGISLADVDAELAERFELEKPEGILIAGINEGSAADKVNLKTGDVIISFNDTRVNTVSQLLEQISKFRPGDEVSLKVKRGNKTIKKDITLRNKYGNTKLVKSTKIASLNAEFEPLSMQEKRYLRLQSGVKVKKVNPGLLMDCGVREGFIITSVNNKRVKTVEDITTALKQLKGETVLLEGMYLNGKAAYYTFKMP